MYVYEVPAVDYDVKGYCTQFEKNLIISQKKN